MPSERQNQFAKYSPERDVLFASVRPAPRAFSEPAASDFFWLRDVDTGEIVGFECPHFSRNVRNRSWLRTLPDFPTYTLVGTDRALTLAELLPELWWTLDSHHDAALALG